MEKEKLISILKSYDFMNNSMTKFSKEYGVSLSTVKKYLVENQIKHRVNKTGIIRYRENGRFAFKPEIKEKINQNNVKIQQKTKNNSLNIDDKLSRMLKKIRF